MTFIEKLSLLIDQEGMSRKRFAEEVGMPYSTIDNWYKRGYENMSVSSLRTICQYFNVTMESMIYDDKDIAFVNFFRPARWDFRPLPH